MAHQALTLQEVHLTVMKASWFPSKKLLQVTTSTSLTTLLLKVIAEMLLFLSTGLTILGILLPLVTILSLKFLRVSSL